MPSAPQTRRRIIDHIGLHMGNKTHFTIYELGSGWGGFCRKLATAFPDATIQGYEISPIPFAVSKIMQWFCFGVNYHINRGDFFEKNMADADVIICYLSPYHMQRFEREIWPTLKFGSHLYSQGFAMATLKQDDSIDVPFSLEKKVFYYTRNE